MPDSSIGTFLSQQGDRKPWTQDIFDALHAPFADEELRTGRDGLTYPKYKAVVDRLNEVFPGCWSAPVTNQEVIGSKTPFVIVRRALIIHHPDYVYRWFENFGGKRIAPDSHGRYNVDNDYKAAATMALLKDALDLGIGLYLTGTKKMDEGLDEAEPDGVGASDFAASAPSPAAKTPAPADSGRLASTNQRTYIADLLKKKGLPVDFDLEHIGFEAASAKINELQLLDDVPRARTAKPAAPAPRTVESQGSEERPTAKPAGDAAKPAAESKKPAAKDEKAAPAGPKDAPAGDSKPAEAPKDAPADGEDEKQHLMTQIRAYIAEVIKSPENPNDKKVTDLFVSMANRQGTRKVKAPEDLSVEELRALFTDLSEDD